MSGHENPAFRMTDGRLEDLRDDFAILRDTAYFNYGAQGPISDSVLAAIFNALERQRQLGPHSTEAGEWAESHVETARGAVAHAIRARADQIAFGESISWLCSAVLWGTEWHQGDELLVSDTESPGITASALNLERRLGVTVRWWTGFRVNAESALASLRAALNPRTRLLLVSHVVRTTGETLPLAEIVDLCRRRLDGPPVKVLVDGSQAFGVLPDAQDALCSDYYLMTAHKWCCGPDGVAMVFARDPGSLKPTAAGWRTGDRFLNPHKDLRKLEVGTPPYPLLAGLHEALVLADRAGDAAWRHAAIQDVRAHLRTGLDELARRTSGLEVLTSFYEGIMSSGIVAVRLQSGLHGPLVGQLESEDILVSETHNPEAVRLCVHYFTSTSEVDRVLGAMERFLAP